MKTLSVEAVIALHDAGLNPGELQGFAGDKSLASVLGRVDNLIAYGMIVDGYDLAAAYAAAIAQGHCFNDGNKRTAFRAMHAILRMNDAVTPSGIASIGDRIILIAQRKIDETEFAAWLRERAEPNGTAGDSPSDTSKEAGMDRSPEDPHLEEDRARLAEAQRAEAAAPHRGSTQGTVTRDPALVEGSETPKVRDDRGTIHDRNSVTSGTEVEPDRGVHPPKGE
ncbi:type II toxin-antitoxin system death-on-curing family toxin [Jannaschia sp. LMIT008]|uniref:type II toxin-antitoxin system death-on-curing family toxin n=1 Tax=Jannaschia maritima TaxID=3032585 RepID=UPI0028118059|nr:type II toxin-antitoxin system death-on-curing family toxin [Jannaschia sp. LMIT008]